MQPTDMRDPDAILARYPGPVTLYLSPGKKLFVLAGGLFVAGIAVWLLIAGRRQSLHDTIVIWIGMLFGAWMVILSVAQLLAPRLASLTLDGDGFEVATLFRRVRIPWRDVGGFGLRWYMALARTRMVDYHLVGAPFGARRHLLPITRLSPTISAA